MPVTQCLSTAKQQRTVLWLLCLATLPLVASGCDSSGDTTPHRSATGAPPSLPRIHEQFTVLPCPKGRARATTAGMEGCAERELLRSNKEIVANERAIFALLGVKGRPAFARAERSWLAYRHSYCNARATSYEGGSIAPVIFVTCEVAINKSHLRELVSFRRELRR
jgi:uncharacterized protein YecT (DUF1311 family)